MCSATSSIRRTRRSARFLHAQRADRVDRVREIGERLKALGYEIDVEAIISTATALAGRSLGRPLIADALVAKGFALDRRDAFDRLLGNDGPAFVARSGTPVAGVAAIITAAGGIASLAHPILLRDDTVLPAYAEAGLAALEVRHREHDAAAEDRYRTLARALGLAVSGGSDFHGEPVTDLGTITLAPEDFEALEARAVRAALASRHPGVTPALEITGVTKSYQALRPLRLQSLTVAPGECVAISGVDAGAAEILVNLITGATLPDEGQIRVFGR